MYSNEDKEQILVMDWAKMSEGKYPELKWLFHCPNGGSRNVVEATKLKRMGVKSGVSDLYLPYPKGSYIGLFIEMKYGNNKLQDSQKEFLKDMSENGHYVITCYKAEDAIETIKDYLNQKLKYPNNAILKKKPLK